MPTSRRRGASETNAGRRDGEALKLVKTLVDDDVEASRLLELFYWSREPGIVELIRAYLDMPERTQRVLSTYLLNGRPQAIIGAFDQQGRLLLARTQAPAPRPAIKSRQPDTDI